MPIRVGGPDGAVHEFPDMTPPDQINSQMSQMYGMSSPGVMSPAPDEGDTPAPAPAPAPDPGMPPGTVPGGMVASRNAGDPDASSTASMVPLSAAAQRAARMERVMGLTGNRAGVMSENYQIQNDPTFLARKSQSSDMGHDAAMAAKAGEIGKRIYDEMNNLEMKAQAWQEHAPGAFNGATGRWNSSDYVQDATGWMNPGASDLHTLLSHDIDKMGVLFRKIPSSGPGGVMTDDQAKTFLDAIGKWMQSRSGPGAWAVTSSAKDMIRATSGLSPTYDAPPRPLSLEDINAINRYAEHPIPFSSRYVGVYASPEARAYLKANKNAPGVRDQFDAKYGRQAADKVLMLDK